MAFVKFFMIKGIFNFGMWSPKAVLAVQLSKHNDIACDKMTITCYPQYPMQLLGFVRILPLLFFILNKTEKLENLFVVQ